MFLGFRCLNVLEAFYCRFLNTIRIVYWKSDSFISKFVCDANLSKFANIFYHLRHASGDHDRATLIAQLINKHQEQKEAFLKACTLARRTAETFLKYSNRSLQYFAHPNESTFRGPETKVKSK